MSDAMRLSDAIRLGALLHPQAFGDYITEDGRTCALGAAKQAGYPKVVDDANAEDLACPACLDNNVRRAPLCRMVIHLNDFHRWTREAIADWVAGHEAVPDQAVQYDEVAG